MTVEPNQNAWMRRIWVIERNHPDVKGSKNRLFAVDPDGQTRILVELQDIDAISVTCATYRGHLAPAQPPQHLAFRSGLGGSTKASTLSYQSTL